MTFSPSDIAGMIDHSLLRPEPTRDEVVRGCALARKYQTAAVCCTPIDVARCRRELAVSEVRVDSGVGFPQGTSTTATRVGVLVKVILENCYLTDDQGRAGCNDPYVAGLVGR